MKSAKVDQSPVKEASWVFFKITRKRALFLSLFLGLCGLVSCGGGGKSKTSSVEAGFSPEGFSFSKSLPSSGKMTFQGSCSKEGASITFSNGLPSAVCKNGRFSIEQDLSSLKSSLKEDKVKLTLSYEGKSLEIPTIYLSSYMKLKIRTTEANESVILPIALNTIHDEGLSVNWGVEGVETQAITEVGHLTHAYATAGDYIITLKGKLKSFRSQGFCTSVSDFPLVGAPDLGSFLGLTDVYQLFSNCRLEELRGGDTSLITSMGDMFNGVNISGEVDISHWDTSRVTTMSSMFRSASISGEIDISHWDTSRLTNTNEMFRSVKGFSSLDLSAWDVSKVTDMGVMFYFSKSINFDVSKWKTGSVERIGYMFNGASSFNPNLKDWDFSSLSGDYPLGNSAGVFTGTAIDVENYSNFFIGLLKTFDPNFQGNEIYATSTGKNYNAQGQRARHALLCREAFGAFYDGECVGEGCVDEDSLECP